MVKDYKEWLEIVTKNVASILGCSVSEAEELIDIIEAETLYSTKDFTTITSSDILVKKIRKENSKVQVRGTFSLNEHVFKQKVSPFCVDLDLSEYEINKLLEKGRQKYHDIQATKIVYDKIISLNLGYPEGSIMILTMEFWITEGVGWFQIPYAKN